MKAEEKTVTTFVNMLTDHPYMTQNAALAKLFAIALKQMPDAEFVTIKVSKWVEDEEPIPNPRFMGPIGYREGDVE